MISEFKELDTYKLMVEKLEKFESVEKFVANILFPKLEIDEQPKDLFHDKKCEKCHFQYKEEISILERTDKKRLAL